MANRTSQPLLYSEYCIGEGAEIVNKTMNLIFMILMAGLALVEGFNIVQNGANVRNVLFFLLFAAFAVRRFLIHQKLGS
jgi:hypothetical protein